MIYRNVSSKEILRKVMRDLRPGTTDWVLDAVEWIGEALEHIGASSQLCTKVCLLQIKDHRAKLPSDLFFLNQVAINTCMSPSTQTQLTELSAQVQALRDDLANYYTTVNQTVTSNANGTYTSSLTTAQLNEFDTWHSTTLNDLRELTNRMHVLETSLMGDASCLMPIGMSTSTFHASVSCTDCPQPKENGPSFIINCGHIQTSFAEGSVCISYKAFPTDEECWPLVPDDVSFREALFWYIHKKLIMRGTTLMAKFDYMTADQYWLKYCTQARNSANYPDVPKMESFLNQWVRLVPVMDRSENFFAQLNAREQLQAEQY